MNILKKMHILLFAVLIAAALPIGAFAAEDTHTVTYIVDGEVLSTQEVAHGADAVAPEIPAKFGYTQIPPQWSSDGKNITEDTTIEAEYTVNEYIVTYKVDNQNYKALTYIHGENVVMIPVPEKAGYTAKWDTIIDVLTDHITVNAVYTEAVPVEPEVPEQPEWDNGDNSKWAPIIIGATAAMIALFVVLRILKKKDDERIAKGNAEREGPC